MGFSDGRGRRVRRSPLTLCALVMLGLALPDAGQANECALLRPGEGSVVFPGMSEILAIAEACSATVDPPPLAPGDPCDIRNMFDLEQDAPLEGAQVLMQQCFEETLARADETRRGITRLHKALSEGRPVDEITALLAEHRASLDRPDNRGHFPLHYALQFYDTPDVVRLLLEAGADPTAFAEDAPRPLAHGINHAAPVEALLAVIAAGAVPIIRRDDVTGTSQFVAPLAATAAGYGPEAVEALMAVTPTLTATDRADILRAAARKGRAETFVWLFDHLPEAERDEGSRAGALYWHLQREDQDARVVTRLATVMDMGAEISTGDTFLDIALKHDAPADVLTVMAANGAFAHMRGPEGYGLLFAIRDLADPGLIPVIVEAGFDIDATVEARLGDRMVTRTALTSAFEAPENAGAKIEQVLQAGFDPRRTCEGTCSPLHLLPVLRFDAQMFRWMVALGLDPMARDAWGDTILHAAARGRNHVMLPSLLRYGVDLDAMNGAGATALWQAYVEIVMGGGDTSRATTVFEMLLEAGADPNIPGPQGATLLKDMARRGPPAMGLAPLVRRFGAK